MSTSKNAVKSQFTIVNGPRAIPVPGLRDLYNYWVEKKGDSDMPGRPDILPEEIVRLLPKIILIDVERDPIRYKFRLVGTEVVRGMGKDVTGIYLDEISSDLSIHDRFTWLALHKTIYYTTAKLDWMDRNFQKYHVLGLPLGDENGDVNMIICGISLYYEIDE